MERLSSVVRAASSETTHCVGARSTDRRPRAAVRQRVEGALRI